MIRLKTKAELAILREGGKRLAKILKVLSATVKPGLTTGELDLLARKLISEAGGEPAFLNYQPEGTDRPFPAALCTSINEEVVHGIPSERVLVAGDVISLDLGLKYQGLFTDMAVTVPVGKISPEAMVLLKVTAQALKAGIAVARAGAQIGDIGQAVTAVAREHGYGVVRELGGHGVGHQVHEEPLIPNYGQAGEGLELKPGMVIAIEPMFNVGSPRVKFLPDGYTVKTWDGGLSAHFEHTLAITETGSQILTR